jgi:hypothetical protein
VKPVQIVKYSATFAAVSRCKPLTTYENNVSLSIEPIISTTTQSDANYSTKKNGMILFRMMPFVKEPGTNKVTACLI